MHDLIDSERLSSHTLAAPVISLTDSEEMIHGCPDVGNKTEIGRKKGLLRWTSVFYCIFCDA